MPSQEKPVVEVEKEAEKEMPSQEKKVMEVKESVKEMEKTARDNEMKKELKKVVGDEEKAVQKRRNATVAEDDDLDVACPVCGEQTLPMHHPPSRRRRKKKTVCGKKRK